MDEVETFGAQRVAEEGFDRVGGAVVDDEPGGSGGGDVFEQAHGAFGRVELVEEGDCQCKGKVHVE